MRRLKTLAMAAPAHAELDGSCHYRELCLFWGSNETGALADFYWNRLDFGSTRYPSPPGWTYPGRGELVKNNAASALNFAPVPARVYYNENWTGPYDDVPAHGRRNLYNTWNDNASFTFLW